MSKKHYIQIASMLKRNHASNLLVWEFASYLASENENFDRAKFCAACGVSS